jgi:hypothetical protein
MVMGGVEASMASGLKRREFSGWFVKKPQVLPRMTRITTDQAEEFGGSF